MIDKQHLRFVLEGHVPRTDDKDKEEYITKESMAHIDDFSHHSWQNMFEISWQILSSVLKKWPSIPLLYSCILVGMSKSNVASKQLIGVLNRSPVVNLSWWSYHITVVLSKKCLSMTRSLHTDPWHETNVTNLPDFFSVQVNNNNLSNCWKFICDITSLPFYYHDNYTLLWLAMLPMLVIVSMSRFI